jgi:hypothetical protein
MKQCPKCEKMNNAYAGICEFCGADIRQIQHGGAESVEIPHASEEKQILKETDFDIDESDTDSDKAELIDIYNQLGEIKSHLSRGSTLFDVNMPFSRMVMLFIKVILAAIPAIMIVGFLFLIFWAFLGGLIFNLFFRGYAIQ